MTSRCTRTTRSASSTAGPTPTTGGARSVWAPTRPRRPSSMRPTGSAVHHCRRDLSPRPAGEGGGRSPIGPSGPIRWAGAHGLIIVPDGSDSPARSRSRTWKPEHHAHPPRGTSRRHCRGTPCLHAFAGRRTDNRRINPLPNRRDRVFSQRRGAGRRDLHGKARPACDLPMPGGIVVELMVSPGCIDRPRTPGRHFGRTGLQVPVARHQRGRANPKEMR